VKIRRLFIALFCAGIFAAFAIDAGFNLYWKLSLAPRLQREGAVDGTVGLTEIQRVQYVEQTAELFLKHGGTGRTISPVPELFLTSWMHDLAKVELWRTPYSSARAKDGPFLGATWAFVHLAAVSRMSMGEVESLRALEDVRQLERLLLSSESHILNLQALQVIGIERDFVQRHRRLFSYLNRWQVPPVEFPVQYRAASAWLPKIWNWGMSAQLVQQIEAASRSNPIFCSAMERGMSDALNFRPLMASKDPDFFQRQMRWGAEWATICHRPEFAKAWSNPKYVPRGVQEWSAMWNGKPSHWLKLKHVMWWKSARVLLGGQVWLEKLVDLGAFEDAEE
jgi:hypothetical protein